MILNYENPLACPIQDGHVQKDNVTRKKEREKSTTTELTMIKKLDAMA